MTPKTSTDPPGTLTKPFPSCQGMKSPYWKFFFEISPIETKLTELNQSYGRHLEIGPKKGEIGIGKIVPGQIPLAGPLNYNLKQ